MIPRLDCGRLLVCLNERGNGYLRQKAGYVLECYRDSLGLSDDFFKACADGLPRGKRYLYQGLQNERHVLNERWRLYTPQELSAITSQGETGGYGI